MNNTKGCFSWLSSFAALFLVAALMVLSGCGGGSSSAPKTTTTTTTTTASLDVLGTTSGNVGEVLSFLVTGGTPGYSVLSTNPSVATVSSVKLSGSLYIFTATLVGGGSDTLIISDASQKTKTLTLTSTAVPLRTTASSAVTIAIGATESYTISGGKAPYAVSSNNTGVATTSVSGTVLTIKGNAMGTASIDVRDADLTKVTIGVTVPGSSTPTTPVALYTTAPSTITIATAGTAKYTVAGGTAPYTASSSNEAVASVVVSGSSLTISANNSNVAGTADIVVKDAAGAAVTIVVTVANSAGTALFTTAPTALTISAIGGARTFTIGGGTSPYSCSSDNANVASVDCTAAVLTITGLADGKAKILIKDATGSASVTVDVNVATAGGFTVIGTSDWTVTASTCPVAMTSPYSVYFINGGTPPYTVSSTSPLVGTIIGVGTEGVPLKQPTTAQKVSISPVTVSPNKETGGYFVVAWPNADNDCAYGSALFKVIDSSGLVPTSIPTFKVTFTLTTPTTSSTTALFTSAPGNTTINAGVSASYTIGGGTAPYSAASSDTAVATASLNGSTLTITGVEAGSATVVVKDVSGTVVSIAVAVGKGSAVTPLYTTAPIETSTGSSLVIGAGVSPTYFVGGGTPPYTSVSSNVTYVTTSVNGSTLTINGVAKGSAVVALTDSAGAVINLGVSVP